MKKPYTQETDQEYSLKEFCSILSISTATGRNWIRLGKLEPDRDRLGKPYFSAAYTKEIQKKLQKDDTGSLKSRRNKKYVSGNALYKNYIPENSPNFQIIQGLVKQLEPSLLTERRIRFILAECAIQLFCQACGKKPVCTENFLSHYVRGEITLGSYDVLVQELLPDKKPEAALAVQEKIPQAFQVSFLLEKNVDILGLLYISLKNLGKRKAEGSYYTPTHTVQALIRSLLPGESKTQPECASASSSCQSAFPSQRTGSACASGTPSVSGSCQGTFPTQRAGTPSASRSCQGAFPTQQAEEACISGMPRVLDPCCGTGNFLLQLPDDFSMEQVFGRDIDKTSILAARINLALKFPGASVSTIKEHIKVSDFLLAEKDSYDFILGNPPWGYQFGKEMQALLKEKFETAEGQHIESYDVFLEQALRTVPYGGKIAFVLPEAMLHVKSHLAVRKLFLRQVQIERLEYLGNVFDKVQCPAVLLQIRKTKEPFSTKKMQIAGESRNFIIQTDRRADPENFNFYISDEEYGLLEKAEHGKPMAFLKNQAEFALGIVTGDNKNLIQTEKTAENEVVFKGADVHKYKLAPKDTYLVYEPEKFQQCAKEAYYRAKEKLFYRFIGSQLIFAYDSQQRLSLNSCNILIPQVPQMDMKYIMAVLNSRIAQFIYSRKFHSMKVLRAYLEQIPLPVLPEGKQREIISLAEKMMEEADPGKWAAYYDAADRKIAAAYGLTEQEYEKIRKPE